MSYSRASIVLPVHDQADHLETIVREHAKTLSRLDLEIEILLVPNGCHDDSARICHRLTQEIPGTRSVESPDPGWGRAVRLGLAAATGDLLAYANSARTSPTDLFRCVETAVLHPGVVVTACRKLRDSLIRRVGGLLYNLECRTLYDLSTWDINGTPKIFPARCIGPSHLTREDDLIDLEFHVLCRRAHLPLLEVPLFSSRRHGGRSTTGWATAANLYWGALRHRKELERTARESGGTS